MFFILSSFQENGLGFTDRVCFLPISFPSWWQTQFAVWSTETCPTETYSRSNAFTTSSTFWFAYSFLTSGSMIFIWTCAFARSWANTSIQTRLPTNRSFTTRTSPAFFACANFPAAAVSAIKAAWMTRWRSPLALSTYKAFGTLATIPPHTSPSILTRNRTTVLFGKSIVVLSYHDWRESILD